MFKIKDHSVEVKYVSRETHEKVSTFFDEHPLLDTYLDELIQANKNVNLVSRKLDRETIREHIIHCLISVDLGLLKHSRRIFDIGTGGGLPGVPLSIVYPDKHFVLNDKSQKKQKALSSILKNCELNNTEINTTPVQDVRDYNINTIVSKHAFKLPALLNQTKKIRWNKIVLWKGDDFQEEIRDINYRPLNIFAYDLSGIDNDFYEGKYILDIKRAKIE